MTNHVLLVHGAWHGAWAWDDVRSELEKDDLVVHTVDLPSSGSGKLGDLYADVDVVRRAIDEVGAPVTLVGHSYGGAVISVAAAGNDAVTNLVYVAAFLLPQRVSILDAVGGQAPPWWSVDEASGSVTVIDPTATSCVSGTRRFLPSLRSRWPPLPRRCTDSTAAIRHSSATPGKWPTSSRNPHSSDAHGPS